ncbi:MAG: TetR/AcrR family transcriptional regulator [Actinomycetota bacterium]
MARPKSEKARARLLAATAELALSEGLAAVTIDEVAARSGVAKTTLYRHFGGKAELLVAALDDMIEPPEAPDTGSLLGDLRAFLASVQPIFADPGIRTLSLEILAAASRSPDFARLGAAFFGGRMGPLLSVVRRAVERGELGEGLDPIDAIELIEGRFITRSMIDPAGVAALDVAELASEVADRLLRAAPA